MTFMGFSLFGFFFPSMFFPTTVMSNKAFSWMEGIKVFIRLGYKVGPSQPFIGRLSFFSTIG